MLSAVDLCNLALSHLGVSTEIANLETEKSKEAQACRRFYPVTRDEALRDFPWPFATAIGALALVEEAPTVEWGYAYRYPAACLAVRRILSGAGRVERPDTRIPYRIARDAAGLLILTDQPQAEAEWTVLVDDPQQYPPDFVAAVALLLAANIAPRVTGGDQFKLGALAFQKYLLSVDKARATAANEESADRPADSEFLTVRG